MCRRRLFRYRKISHSRCNVDPAIEAEMRSVLGLLLVFVWIQSTRPQQSSAALGKPVLGKFSDVTAELGVRFQHIASHTSRKYLIETMGSGVALFDFDNDGRLDIFLVNGAPVADPSAKGSIPQKSGPNDGNLCFAEMSSAEDGSTLTRPSGHFERAVDQ